MNREYGEHMTDGVVAVDTNVLAFHKQGRTRSSRNCEASFE